MMADMHTITVRQNPADLDALFAGKMDGGEEPREAEV